MQADLITFRKNTALIKFTARTCLPLMSGLLCIFLLVPIQASAAPLEELKSGIEGLVRLAPTCPEALVPRSDCQDHPYSAAIAIYNAQGKLIHQVQSDAEGHFRIFLAPGIYRIRPQSSIMPPHAEEQTITVLKDQMTPLAIKYDSGIR